VSRVRLVGLRLGRLDRENASPGARASAGPDTRRVTARR
jgi:hypothetical protein